MQRIVVKETEAWLQVRWLWMWWTVKIKTGTTEEVLDWVYDREAEGFTR